MKVNCDEDVCLESHRALLLFLMLLLLLLMLLPRAMMLMVMVVHELRATAVVVADVGCMHHQLNFSEHS